MTDCDNWIILQVACLSLVGK